MDNARKDGPGKDPPILQLDSIRVEDLSLSENGPATVPRIQGFPSEAPVITYSLVSGNPGIAEVSDTLVIPRARGKTARYQDRA